MRTVTPALALVFDACAEPSPSESTVRAPRVFALVTPTPSAAPDEAVAVEAIWFDPSAPRSDPGGFLWRVCPALRDPRDCARSSVGMTLPGAGPEVLLSGADTDRDVYLAWCPAGLPTLDPALGHARCPEGPALESLRTVRVDPSPGRNRNPEVAAFELVRGGDRRGLTPGVLSPSLPCGVGDCRFRLELQATPGSAEPTEGGPERLVVNFFTDAGEVRPARIEGAPMAAVWSGGEGREAVRVWAVLRDGRGGVTVAFGRFSP